jgi:membrane protease YdiL (CAAX protease family)
MNSFWNTSEHRLRAVWRFLIQGLFFAALLSGFGMAGGAFNAWLPTVVGKEAGLWTGATLFTLIEPISVILSIWVCGRWLDRRRFVDFGLHFTRSWWIDFGFGLGLGAVLMALIFLVELGLGWVTITAALRTGASSFIGALLIGLLDFIGVGISEELISRGYQLRNLAEGLNLPRIGPRRALILSYLITSTMFGLYHLGNPNMTWISVCNLILAGLLLGLPYILTGELAISIGLHITWNFFQGKVFGFPVSGGASGTTVIATQQGGPELWTGGAFGPEGGLLGVLTMLLGMVLIVLWLRRRSGCLVSQERLAIYSSQTGSEQKATED